MRILPHILPQNSEAEAEGIGFRIAEGFSAIAARNRGFCRPAKVQARALGFVSPNLHHPLLLRRPVN